MAALVGFSRVTLPAHFLCDVFVGEELAVHREEASVCHRDLAAALDTRFAASGLTVPVPFSALDAVATLTLPATAISFRVIFPLI
jgi:hypothetical protein